MKQLRGDDHSWVPTMIVTSYFYIYGMGRLVTIGQKTGGGGGSGGSGGSGGTPAGTNKVSRGQHAPSGGGFCSFLKGR